MVRSTTVDVLLLLGFQRLKNQVESRYFSLRRACHSLHNIRTSEASMKFVVDRGPCPKLELTAEGSGAKVKTDTDNLTRRLRGAGLSQNAIDAAWPSWWSDELASAPSGHAELRFALARRLGLSPKGLLGDRVEFVWQDEAYFKHLSTENAVQRAAITSFGMAIGRVLVKATPRAAPLGKVDALYLRRAVLAGRQFVDLHGILSTCWAVGIPVIYLRAFPLKNQAMHAMVVRIEDRYAILLGRNASYPAPVAFTLAHELGHILLGHLTDAPALVDLKDPATATEIDDQEREADRFGLTLLTSRPDPIIETTLSDFNAPTLANAVIHAAPQYRIEPGTLALVLAHSRGAWPVAMSALKFIYERRRSAWREVNGIANSQLAWDEISVDAANYVRNVMDTHG